MACKGYGMLINCNEDVNIDQFYQNCYCRYNDNVMKTQFNRLKGITYLDHAGTTLYADSQLKAVSDELSSNVYGNPHSRNASSKLSTEVVDHVRMRVVEHFNTSLDEYSVIFTSGATGALKLLAEAFDWTAEVDGGAGHFMYLEDNHTSVLGMRELAVAFGATVSCLSVDDCCRVLGDDDHIPEDIRKPSRHNCMFAFPAQSNFCGRKYPLSWISDVQRGLLRPHLAVTTDGGCRWTVLLDAAAFVGTSFLDLGRWKPDFVTISFHKMFGLPTGLGALLVHRSAHDLLPGRYFGGGTVSVSLAREQFHVFRPDLSERFEAGTVSFLDIMAVRHGLHFIHNVARGGRRPSQGMMSISGHTFHLARHVHHRLASGRHGNGASIAVLYCGTDFEDVDVQGSIVNFNLLRPDGQFVGFVEVEKVAAVYDIHFRTGCMCNPGACQRYLRLTLVDLKHHFEAGHVCGDEVDLIDGRPTGSIRISFGSMSTQDDANRFLHMIESCFVDRSVSSVLTTTPVEDFSGWNNKNAPRDLDACPVLSNISVPCQKVELLSRRQSLKVASECNCSMFGQKMCAGSHVTGIFLYPVKSCGAFQVVSWAVGSRGFRFDREWMVVVNGGVSLTQKREPKMCLIKPEIDLHNGLLWLHFNDVPSVSVPLGMEDVGAPPPMAAASYCPTKVCGDRVKGVDCGDEIGSWLSVVLGREGCRLLRQLPDSNRRCREKGVISTAELSLANEAQYLLLNGASATYLAKEIEAKCKLPTDKDPVSGLYHDTDYDVSKLVARFRGNLVVDGPPAFAEENWKRITIGNHVFKVQGLCNRCQMVCIDQDTGEKTREPLLTLAAKGHKVNFGIYLSQLWTQNESMVISTGDPIVI